MQRIDLYTIKQISSQTIFIRLHILNFLLLCDQDCMRAKTLNLHDFKKERKNRTEAALQKKLNNLFFLLI